MGKRVLSFVCVLLFSAFVFAEVQIPQKKRVKNFPSGCCVWCAVENLGNVHGVDQLKGIAQYRHDNYGKVMSYVRGGFGYDPWGNLVELGGYWLEANHAPGTPERVHNEFRRLKIENYRLQEQDDLDMGIINEAIKKDLGCAIGVKDYPGPGNYHMITLTELTDKECVFVDNNGGCERFVKSREWFNEHWTGYTILIYPNYVKPERIKEKPVEVIKPEVIKTHPIAS